ncbi:hypothetical protein [Caldicellulosiruptor naganoensis]|uniref:DUF2254 domain-containing protein n=1 Tax=Caldicellulosiruptor naganoensis TaxID=29324 RepID=A0ABY7BJR7_9FIRM|nr:hypothetical protein [Caldicellulosiruptor naganoensis]WAM32587.1 hypothetical protein OTJ99_001164 [Caldicellulosiruptor naganoensis]
MAKIKLFRGRRMLSSILIVVALYYLAPNVFSHDRFSANRLLSWLLSYQIFIFLSSVITISLLIRFLSVKYSPKISNYILSLCWNDILVVFLGVSLLHTTFMLASVNVVDYSSEWIVKGVNFDIIISFVDILVVIIYFCIFYTISQPKKLFIRMLKDLNGFAKAGEVERVNEQFLIIKEFIRKTNLFFDSTLLLSVLDNPKSFQLLIEQEKNNSYLEEIIGILLKNTENALLSERTEEFKKTIDFLSILLDKFQSSKSDIFETLITDYFTLISHNIQRLEANQVLYLVKQLKKIFEMLSKKQIKISEKSKSDLIEILDRLSYIILSENSAGIGELFSILEFYISLFAYFEKDYVFYTQLKEEFDTFVISLLQNMHGVPTKEIKEYVLKMIEKAKPYRVSFAEMALVYIFLLTLEYKMLEIGYVLFNIIIDSAKTKKLIEKGNCSFYHNINSSKKMFYLYKCLLGIKNKVKNETFKKKMYKKYLISVGNCRPKKLCKDVMLKNLSGRK